MESQIKEGISAAFQALYAHNIAADDVALQPTRKDFEGTYTFLTFPFARISKKGPEETGNELGEYLKEHVAVVADYNTVKGFLNLVLSENSQIDQFASMINGADIASSPVFQVEKKNKTVVVEYSSPNTNKPLHLGHLRNNFLGNSVARILEASGHKVVKVQIINDRGIHICKSMLAWLRFGNGETPESTGIKGDHLVGKYYVAFDKAYKQEIAELVADGMPKEVAEKEAPILKAAQEMLQKWENKDPEVYSLWETMNGWVYAGFDATYKRMGVDFDKLYYESDTYLIGRDRVMEGLEKGVFFKKEDGSVWVDLTDEGLDQKLLLRKDGTSVYMTQDIGTALMRYDDYPELSQLIYTVGNEQEYHFRVLFQILKKLGYDWAEACYHLSYGMVDLPEGKMKSREGTVVDADDLMREMAATAKERTMELGKIDGFTDEQAENLYSVLGLGALKYFLLKVDPLRRMLFNPQESIEFQGNTGPFIQYAHARIRSIMRKAEQLNMNLEDIDYAKIQELHETEKDLIHAIGQYTEKLHLAAEKSSPSVIAQYVYDLAKGYNRFFTEVSIFNEEDAEKRKFRVALSGLTAQTIKLSMGLLGIDVPERM
ncbi:MAG: arginine--tRNA ligase [Roseivirga sp.]